MDPVRPMPAMSIIQADGSGVADAEVMVSFVGLKDRSHSSTEEPSWSM